MKQRILAVDDEPDMLRLLERIVTEKTPYAIKICNNSLEVPKLLEAERFDLIITDLKMPGLDGLDILRILKEEERDEEIIIITAFGSLDTAVQALSRGVHDYITKPFKKEQIISAVGRAMRWQRAKREASRAVSIFETEPYEEALAAFREEYLARLAERCGGDRSLMTERSGLPEEIVLSHLGEESPER